MTMEKVIDERPPEQSSTDLVQPPTAPEPLTDKMEVTSFVDEVPPPSFESDEAPVEAEAATTPEGQPAAEQAADDLGPRPTKQASKGKDARLAQLTWEARQAQRERDEWKRRAEAAAALLATTGDQLKNKVAQHHTVSQFAVSAALERADANIENARERLSRAISDGDAAQQVKAQQDLARATAERVEIEKVSLPEQATIPQEAYASESLRKEFATPIQPLPPPPPEALTTWAESNPWFNAGLHALNSNQSSEDARKVLIANQLSDSISIKTGKGLDDPEHFVLLDQAVRAFAPDLFGAPPVQQAARPATPRQVQPQPVVAAAGSPSAPAGSRRPLLTEQERQFARAFGMTDEAYAKSKGNAVR